MNNRQNLLLLSTKDFLSTRMLKYSLAPFIISMIILYILFFMLAGIGLDSLGTLDVASTQMTMQNGVPHTESLNAQLQGSAIIQFLMGYAVTSWLASFLVYTIGSFLTLYVSIFVAILVVGFLTPFVLKELQKMHYQDVAMVGYSNIIEGTLLMLKWAFVMLLLFFVFIPLYFIPVINIIAFNFPLYYFFHKAITFDVASSICSREENKEIKYYNGNALRVKTLFLYLVSLIPFAVFFGAIFYVIYLGHTYFIEVKKIRHVNAES